ncbi:MAG: pentapeptide repeat-containing protein [Syntrophaceae bacterium]|nr:pentapeptide repeat-containing protein [Syntrophaceae bacterium]
MTDRLIGMQGVEFIRKVLAGERDFSRIDLEEGFDLCGDDGFDELQEYLKRCDLKSAPINIEKARLRYLDADGIYLPFLRASGAHLKHTALMGANLENAQLENVDLRYSKLCTSNLTGSNFKNADLRAADLSLALLNKVVLVGANVETTDLEYANLQGADLKGVKNLDRARFLKTVNFQFADIAEKEKSIIRQALWAEESKKRRLFGGSG